jgi:hypothetical protein
MERPEAKKGETTCAGRGSVSEGRGRDGRRSHFCISTASAALFEAQIRLSPIQLPEWEQLQLAYEERRQKKLQTVLDAVTETSGRFFKRRRFKP